MNSRKRIPIRHEDNGELLGFIQQDKTGWDAQTVFGYSISRTTDQAAAERIVREGGLSFLKGVWQYYDVDDQEWHACVLKGAYEHHVTVLRTTTLGYSDPNDYKIVTIQSPDETNLVNS